MFFGGKKSILVALDEHFKSSVESGLKIVKIGGAVSKELINKFDYYDNTKTVNPRNLPQRNLQENTSYLSDDQKILVVMEGSAGRHFCCRTFS